MEFAKRKEREGVLQALYGLDFAQDGEGEELLMSALHITRKNARLCLVEAKKIFNAAATFDAQIKQASTSFDWPRIGRIERNILRQALYLLSLNQLPRPVVIAEALRLAKKFGTPESARFIHAIIEKCAPRPL